jgi:uncharacterized membrane protein YedE/YeeE
MDWLQGLLGGVLIGASAALLLLTHGRIAGISGMLAGALLPQGGELGWRIPFLAALATGGALFSRLWPEQFAMTGLPPWPLWIVSGLLVGVGTRVGGGCTSGHGVCGVGRGSKRSLVATLVFVGTAMITVMVRS